MQSHYPDFGAYHEAWIRRANPLKGLLGDRALRPLEESVRAREMAGIDDHRDEQGWGGDYTNSSS